MNPIIIQVTCKDEIESDLITNELLSRKLIACAKFQKLKSKFLWEAKIEESDEVLVIMDTYEDNFSKIEEVILKMHSYQTPNLIATKIDFINSKTDEWLKKSLRK